MSVQGAFNIRLQRQLARLKHIAGHREWAYGVALLAVAVVLLLWGDALLIGFRLLAWASWLVGVAFLLRRPWQMLFGPVLFYDLVRTARRRQYFAIRCGYAAILLASLFVFYTSWFPQQGWDSLFEDTHLSIHDSADFASHFFSTFLIVQFVAVLVLTPVFSAGAIAEEKERRTLEFLLATDLANREIVLSKLVSRLAQTGLLVLTGLPILALMQFLGGVDPNLLLAAFLGTGLMMMSVASLSVLIAIYNRTAWDAIFRTYLVLLGLFAVTSCSGLPWLAPWSNLGNPVTAWLWVTDRISMPVAATPPTNVYEQTILGYAAAHLLMTAVSVVWAIRALRPATMPGLWQRPQGSKLQWAANDGWDPLSEPEQNAKSWGPESEPEPPPTKRQGRPRPPVTDEPLMWKEMSEEAVPIRRPVEILLALVLLTLLVALSCGGLTVLDGRGVQQLEPIAQTMRLLAVIIASFMLLLVALNAAGRFSREFEKQTLDGLLVTPVERDAILKAKWWASICHVRGFWWFASLFVVWGMMSGVMPAFVLLFLGWWLVYAAFLAGLGLLFSLLTRSTLRATLWTPLGALAVGAGGWLALEAAVQVLRMNRWWPETIGALESIQDFGFMPPVALWCLLPTWWDAKEPLETGASLAALAGMVFYAGMAWLVWRLVRDRFRLISGENASAKRREPPRVVS